MARVRTDWMAAAGSAWGANVVELLQGVLEVIEALLLGLPLVETGVGGLPFEVDAENVIDLLDGFDGAVGIRRGGRPNRALGGGGV